MRRMYSPVIYPALIPCLHHAAREREVPMTQLANAFVYRGLCSALLGPTVRSLLPKPDEVAPPTVRMDPSLLMERENFVYSLDSVVLAEEPEPEPFRSLGELDCWYSAAAHGLARTFAPEVDWHYRNAACHLAFARERAKDRLRTANGKAQRL